jgi:hypothetical protein
MSEKFSNDPLKNVLNVPAKKAFTVLGIGDAKGRELIAEGHLETVCLGPRSNVVTVASIRRLQQTGIPRK